MHLLPWLLIIIYYETYTYCTVNIMLLLTTAVHTAVQCISLRKRKKIKKYCYLFMKLGLWKQQSCVHFKTNYQRTCESRSFQTADSLQISGLYPFWYSFYNYSACNWHKSLSCTWVLAKPDYANHQQLWLCSGQLWDKPWSLVYQIFSIVTGN